jgi:hypothetical protein
MLVWEDTADMKTLLPSLVVLVSLVAAFFLVAEQVNKSIEQNRIRQIQKEARERREKLQQELAELEAQHKVEHDALEKKLDEENAQWQAGMDKVMKRYRTAVENADIAEVRRIEGILNKAWAEVYPLTEEGKAGMRRKAISARYADKWEQLSADYRTAMEKRDWEAVRHIADDMKTLERMSRDIK